jgi:hypothetical protein
VVGCSIVVIAVVVVVVVVVCVAAMGGFDFSEMRSTTG